MFAVTAGAGLLVNAAFHGLISLVSLYFQQASHLLPLQTGLAFLAINLVAARGSARFGACSIIATGTVIATAACMVLKRVAHSTSCGLMLTPLRPWAPVLGYRSRD
jgi:DHA2 family methylenomycin A resistance protein-like MFS transporter